MTAHEQTDVHQLPHQPARVVAEELVHLSRVVGDYDGTNLEFIPTIGRFEESHYQLMTDMSVAANRPLNWNLIAVNLNPRQMEAMEVRLGASDFAQQRDARAVQDAGQVLVLLKLLAAPLACGGSQPLPLPILVPRVPQPLRHPFHVGIVKDELEALLTGPGQKLRTSGMPPTTLVLCGLQGSGKTTTLYAGMRMLASDDAKEGQRAFVEKRKPNWQGR
jgi:hypothetical protein